MYDHQLQKVNAIDNSKLVKKANYDTKIKGIEDKFPNHDKYITIPEFKKLTKENFDERSKQANLVSKYNIDNFILKTDFDNKLRKISSQIALNKTKHVEVDKKTN